MNFERNPGIDLTILVQNSFGSDQTRRIEDNTRPSGIDFQHRTALYVDVMFARLLFEPLGVLVWDLHGEFFAQLPNGRKDRRGMREFREYDKPDWQERSATGHSRINHRQHPISIRAHRATLDGIR